MLLHVLCLGLITPCQPVVVTDYKTTANGFTGSFLQIACYKSSAFSKAAVRFKLVKTFLLVALKNVSGYAVERNAKVHIGPLVQTCAVLIATT